MSRFDNRDKEQFARDIKFGTKIESFWIGVWQKEIKLWPEFELLSIEDYGVDNTGGFVAKSNGNADYYIRYNRYGSYFEHPLEVKWAPSNDKATFKIQDLHNYVKQNASILLVYNTSEYNLKKPKDCQPTEHIETIKTCMDKIKWAIVDVASIKKILNDHTHFPVPYMGNKMGLILDPLNFKNYMTEREMRHILPQEETSEL